MALCKASAEDWTDEMVLDEDDYSEDSYGTEEPAEPQVGDGEEGGGVFLGSTYWGTKALTIAQEVILPFKDELEIFSFKATNNGHISVRLDKLSNKSHLRVQKELFVYLKTWNVSRTCLCM